MKPTRFFLGSLLLLALAGCATMDKSECRTADWQIIGLEDGAKGHPLTYVGRHREACAEYGVKPNLALYEAGHADGLRRYCTPPNGFRQGRAGRGYNEVCPAGLEGSFLAAYDTGLELHRISSDIKRMHNEVRSMQKDLSEMRERQQNVENLLVNGTLSASVRKSLLDQFQDMQSEIASLEISIHETELEAARRQGEFDVLDAAHGY